MTYYIPATGSVIENPVGPWNLDQFDTWVTYMTSHPYKLWESLETVSTISIDQFAGQVAAQTRVHPISMGCYSSSQVVHISGMDSLYLCVPQTGRCVYFKLYASD